MPRSKPIRLLLVLAATVLVSSGCQSREAETTSLPAAPHSNSEWRLIGNNGYEQHFSPLTKISDANAGQLKLKWYADMPVRDGLVGVPLVADGVVYQSGPLGLVFANDLRTGFNRMCSTKLKRR